MKTLTEFHSQTLRHALKTKQELVAAGKTAEELPAAMGEALKLEGDKLTFMVNALELVEPKMNDLKRVVVFTLAEGEKAPNGAQAKGEHHYTTEYYAPVGRPAPQQDTRGRRDGGRGDKKGRGGKGGGRGARGPGGPGGDRNNDRGGPRADRGERRPPQGARPPRPAGAPPKITPVQRPAPAAAEPAASAETPKENQ